jgi:NAD(P)-dependent dehydrogenase (short-subunit alcohol dehydrogenase family)
MEPKGKVILVTGASSGIGLAAARALAREGASVLLAARSAERLEAEAARIRAAGGAAFALALDVTSDASVAAAVDIALARCGRIDALVNNAGNAGELRFWAEAAPQHLRAMFDVHVFGAERIARAVLPAMRAQGGGTIVNVASTVAWVPMPSAAAYSAAKAAIVSLSESLRAELAPHGIEVVLFAPPHTSTEAGRAWPLEGPRIQTPEWVAEELIATLRSGRSSRLAGASNRMLLVIRRIAPAYASSIMRGIGLRAEARVRAGRERAATGAATARERAA